MRFVIALCWSLNYSKCDGQFLFSSLVIAIFALHVKCHSLQERNVLGNVLIVDHHVKKKVMYVYSVGRLELKALNEISDKHET